VASPSRDATGWPERARALDHHELPAAEISTTEISTTEISTT
jgi:hypothetical protein